MNKKTLSIFVLLLTYSTVLYCQFNEAYYSSNVYAKGKGDYRIFINLYQSKQYQPKYYYDFLNIIPEYIFAPNDKINIGARIKIRSVSHRMNTNPASTFLFQSKNKNADNHYARIGINQAQFLLRHKVRLGHIIAAMQHNLSIPILKNLEGNNQLGFLDWNGVGLHSQLFIARNNSFIHYFIECGLSIDNIRIPAQFHNAYIPISVPCSFLPGIYFARQHYTYILLQYSPSLNLRITKNNNNDINIDNTNYSAFGQIGLGYKYFAKQNLEIETILTYFNNFSSNSLAFTSNLGLRKYF